MNTTPMRLPFRCRRGRRAPATRALAAALALLLAAPALLAAGGCAAWRATTRVPVYEQTRKARRHLPTSRDVWVATSDVSIFRTLEAPVPYYDDPSLPVKLDQRSWGHWVLAGPAWLVETVYMLAASPALFVAGLVASDQWYLSQREPSIDGPIEHWTEVPWWLLTRPVHVIDWVMYDLPMVLVVFPFRAVFLSGRDAGWRERVSDEPEDGMQRRTPAARDATGWGNL